MDNNISTNLKKNNSSKSISNNCISDRNISNSDSNNNNLSDDNDLANNNNKKINFDIEDYYNDKKKKLSGLFNNARLKIHKFKRLNEFDEE